MMGGRLRRTYRRAETDAFSSQHATSTWRISWPGKRDNMNRSRMMAETEALVLLKKKLGSLSDMNMVAGLVGALELLPLAISQAAAYIRARAPRSSVGSTSTNFGKASARGLPF